MSFVQYLAEVKRYSRDLAVEVTDYYCTGFGFTTTPADTPANQWYDPRIKQAVDITRALFSGSSTQGASRVGYGELMLSNADGALDLIIADALDGRGVRILRAESPYFKEFVYSDFVEILHGSQDQPEYQGDYIHIKIKDDQFQMQIPLQTTKFSGAGLGTLEGVAGDLKGKPKPLCYGTPSNVQPPCVETAKQIYQVHDGAIASVANVYDQGVALGTSFDWLARATGFGADWVLDYAFGAGLHVIVGKNGKIFTSPDTITWTSRVSGFGASDVDFISPYANGMFIATGQSGKLSTSPDGITWTLRAPGLGGVNTVGRAAYGNSVWVVGTTSQVSTSADGITWAATAWVGIVAAGMGDPVQIAFGNGYFVAAGPGDVMRSRDGLTWIPATIANVSSVSIFIIRFLDGQFIIAGTHGLIATSATGTDWKIQTVANPFGGGSPGASYSAIAFGNGLLAVADTSGDVVYSADRGVTWVVNTGASSTGLLFAAQNMGFGGGVFVIVTAGFGPAGNVYISTPSSYASSADLLDDTKAPQPGTFKAYLTGGYFRLGVKPVGTLTCDPVQGAAPANRTTAQVYKQLLARGGYVPNAGDITALDAANSSVIGFWTMDEMFIAPAIDQVIGSVGGWWGVDSQGVFRCRQFTAPSATVVASYTRNDLLFTPTRQTVTDPNRGIPIWRATVNWGQNYTVQTSDLAGSITAARRTYLQDQWRAAKQEDPTVQAVHLLASDTVENSLLTVEADALLEAARRLDLRSKRRDRLQLVAPFTAANAAVELGDTVQLVNSRYGGRLVGWLDIFGQFTDDANVLSRWVVIGIQLLASKRQIIFNVWGPGQEQMNIVDADTRAVYLVSDTGLFVVSSPE